MADMLHLTWKGKTLWFKRGIPKELRSVMREPDTGKSHYRRNLHTSDLVQAHVKRAALNPQFEAEIKLASKRLNGEPVADMRALADELRRWGDGGDGEPHDQRPSVAQEVAQIEAERIERQYGKNVGRRFYLRAIGRPGGTEIDEHLERWIAEKSPAPRTVMKWRKTVGDLTSWRATLYAEDITRDVARTFVDEVIAKPGRRTATINGAVSVLSMYWKWMLEQSLLSDGRTNPWPTFRRKKERPKPDERERAFTAEELKAIFAAPCRRDVRDAAVIGALTGARIEEIASLKVKHVDLGAITLHVPGTKTVHAERTIPLHSHLKDIFADRIKGKPSDAWLFHELPERKADSPLGRSTPISKAFTRFRKAAGVDVRVEGKRRSLTNFHSLRRWLAKRLKEEGASADVRDAILGWSSGDMRDRYAVGADLMRQMREALEKVRLPR
jgi:integrase